MYIGRGRVSLYKINTRGTCPVTNLLRPFRASEIRVVPTQGALIVHPVLIYFALFRAGKYSARTNSLWDGCFFATNQLSLKQRHLSAQAWKGAINSATEWLSWCETILLWTNLSSERASSNSTGQRPVSILRYDHEPWKGAIISATEWMTLCTPQIYCCPFRSGV